jgi:hypothetical protein
MTDDERDDEARLARLQAHTFTVWCLVCQRPSVMLLYAGKQAYCGHCGTGEVTIDFVPEAEAP